MRSVVITGVSRGLGAAFFDEFNAAGDHVLALGRRFTEAQKDVARSHPGRIWLRETDLANPASLPDAVELGSFVDSGGSAEVVLIHNGAVFEPFGPIGSLSPQRIVDAVAVNLTAPMLLTNALFGRDPIGPGTPPRGLAGRRVMVVFISSSAAHRISGGRSVYASTKRAGETFFASLDDERGRDSRVRMAIIDPGIIDTEMQALVRDHARADAYFPGRERFLDRYERGELPSPSDVARRIIAEHLS